MRPAEGRPAAAARAAARRADALRWTIPWQPWSVLLPLVLVQWAAVAGLAVATRHNSWLYYQGGDQTWYWTSAWAIANGSIPYAAVGWGWSYLAAPVALAVGPDFLEGLPVLVLLQTAVILPLLLLSIYSLGARIAGRRWGYWAAAFWVAAPFLAILGWDPRYHERWVEQFLPQLLGLTGMSDLAATAAVTGAAALLLRALQERDVPVALLSGLVAGFSLGVKPACAPFLVGAGLALIAARRWREGAAFAAALLPGVVALALWKQRGLGESPLFALDQPWLAASAGTATIALPIAMSGIGRYVSFDWSHLNEQLVALREYFWSPRLLEALPLAGLIAVARRSLPATALLCGWFGAFLAIKGTYAFSTVDSGSFWRMLMPALPAYGLLAALVPSLVPAWRPARGTALSPGRPRQSLRRPRQTVAIAAVVLAALPIALFAAGGDVPAGSTVRDPASGLYLTTSRGLDLQAQLEGDEVRLSWRRPPSDPLRATGYVDRPGPGRWSYAVQVRANWRDDPSMGDPLLYSRPVAVDVG